MEKEITEIKVDIGELKTHFGYMKSDISEIKKILTNGLIKTVNRLDYQSKRQLKHQSKRKDWINRVMGGLVILLVKIFWDMVFK